METQKNCSYFMIRPTGSENHQFLPKCCKYVGHTCNGLNIPQKYSRYAAKKKENFDSTAKLGLDFKIQMVKFGLDFKMQMAKLGKLWSGSQKIEIRNEFRKSGTNLSPVVKLEKNLSPYVAK